MNAESAKDKSRPKAVKRITRLALLVIASFTACLAAGMLLISYVFSRAVPLEPLEAELVKNSIQTLRIYGFIWFSLCFLAIIAFMWMTPKPVSSTAQYVRLGLICVLFLFLVAGVYSVRSAILGEGATSVRKASDNTKDWKGK